MMIIKYRNSSLNQRYRYTPGRIGTLQIIAAIYFVFTFSIKSLYFESSFTKSISVIYLNVFCALFIISWTVLMSAKKSFITLTLFNLLLSILMIANNLYFRYYDNLLSFHLISQIGVVGKLEGTVKTLIDPKDLLYLIDFIILIPFYYFYFVRKGIQGSVGENYKARILIFSILMVLSFTAVSQKVSAISKSDPELFTTVYDNKIIEEKTGMLVYQAFDIYRNVKELFLNEEAHINEAKNMLEAYFSNKKADGNQYFGEYKDKNLIMVQMESLQEFVINAVVNGREITPNLNSLIKDSLYFNNLYVQTAAGNTSDAELLTNASMYPTSQGATYERFGENSYHSLANILRGRRYSTFSVHGFKPEFWNRFNAHKAMGFEEFYSSNELDMADSIGWGLNDNSLFRQSIDIMKKEDKPFYSFIITLTNHHPYDAYAELSDFDVAGVEGELMQNYLKSVHEADKAIGDFIQQLKDSGFYENSILVFYGDHEGITGKDSILLDDFFGIEEGNGFQQRQYEKVPLIIHLPDEKLKGIIRKTAGQIDVMPTLLNLLGENSRYSFGNDLLNVRENIVILRDGSYMDEELIYIRSIDKYYDKDTNRPIDNNDVQSKKQEVLNQLELSDLVLETDLFKKLDSR